MVKTRRKVELYMVMRVTLACIFMQVWREGRGVDYHALLSSYRTSGFQATNFGMAVEQITKMVRTVAK